MEKILIFALLSLSAIASDAAGPISIWPDFAPGETTKNQGVPLPANPKDSPPITRVEKITQPTMRAFLPDGGGNGAAVLVMPGGGFGYVVPDLEGSETAAFLNPLGISVFVLNYRTKIGDEAEMWQRPLQDSQRAIRYLRANAKTWGLDPAKIGLLAFSAGGQVGAIHVGDYGDAYEKTDAVDELSARPDFAMLVYPWNVADNKTGQLMEPIKIGKDAPPTFLVHTDDDKSSALGAASIYMELKKAGVSAELHVYQNGGHGYGVRERDGSAIGTWKDRASEWLVLRGIGATRERDGLSMEQVPDGNYLVNIDKPNGVKKLINYEVRDGWAVAVTSTAEDSVGLEGRFSAIGNGVFLIQVSNKIHRGTLFWVFSPDGSAAVKEVPDRGEQQRAVPVEGATLEYPDKE